MKYAIIKYQSSNKRVITATIFTEDIVALERRMPNTALVTTRQRAKGDRGLPDHPLNIARCAGEISIFFSVATFA